jgi:hypothetical protein
MAPAIKTRIHKAQNPLTIVNDNQPILHVTYVDTSNLLNLEG